VVTSFKVQKNGNCKGPPVGRWSAKEQSCLKMQSGTKSKETFGSACSRGKGLGQLLTSRKPRNFMPSSSACQERVVVLLRDPTS
jgi:hypothetical protein